MRQETPKINPVTAGKNAKEPRGREDSIAGISRLHTEAAVMTPAAKPERNLVREGFTPLMKNTQAEPRAVPRKGMSIPFSISKCNVSPHLH